MSDVLDLLRSDLVPLAPYAIPHPPNIRARLDANESPHALPPDLAAALGARLAAVPLHRYPDGHATALRALLARETWCDPAQIVIGNGSDELISLLLATFARPRPGEARARVAFPWPSFVVYRIAALAHGLEPIEVPLRDDFTLDPSLLSRTLSEKRPNLVLFALPNNPTGTLWPRGDILTVIQNHPDTIVVADEAYLAYSGETYLPELSRYRNLVVMRTLSKLGLAALRVGYLVAQPDIAAAIEKIRPPYNVGAMNQAASVHILEQSGDWLRARARDVIAERDRLAAALARVPDVVAYPSRANFILVRVGTPGDGRATALWNHLVARGILVRNFDRPGPLSGCLRITVGTREENDLLLAAL